MTAYNLHEFWDSGRTGSATCIDADGSLVLGLMNLVDTRLNDSGEWTPTGVTVDTTNPADELVTNGTFDSGISGWTDGSDAGGTISWNASGYMDVTNTAGTARANQTVTLEAGKTYRASVNIISPPAGGGAVQIAVPGETATTLFDIDALGAGEHIVEYTATADGDHYLAVKQFSVGTSTIDNVSIRPLISSGTDSAGEERYLLTEDTSTGLHRVFRSVSYTAGKTYRHEFVVKPAGRSSVSISLLSAAFGADVRYIFDLDAETASQEVSGTNDSGSVENLGDGEYLCTLTVDATATVSSACQYRLANDAGATNYTGDGTSGIYVSQATVYESSVGPRAEHITNGTFDSGISGWIASGGGTLTWSSGEVDVSSPGGYIGRAEQVVPTEVGKTYRISVGYTGGSDNGRVNIRENGGAFTFIKGLTSSSTSAEDLLFEFTAISDSTLIQLVHYGASTGNSTFDNVSVLPVTPQMQKSSKDNSLFMENETGAPKYALRIDHKNGVPEVLAEPASTNEIRNSTMQGAAVGLLSAGGSLPTNWGRAGLTSSEIEVVALGEEDGFSYIDIRFNGTPTGLVQVNFESSTQASAAEGQDWTSSFYAKIVGGDTTNINESRISHNYYNSGVYENQASTNITLTSDHTRFQVSDVAPANTTSVTTLIKLLWTSGAIDITLRIYAPQLEQHHVATSSIPTTTAAAARVKDEPTRAIPEGFIQGEGSIYFEGSIDYKTGGSGFPRVFQIDDGSNNDRVGLIPTESSGALRVSSADGGVGTGTGSRVVNSGQVFKASARYADGDLALSVDGQGVESAAPASISTALTTARIGDLGGVTDTVRIRDFRLFPYSSPAATPGWSNATLETISGA